MEWWHIDRVRRRRCHLCRLNQWSSRLGYRKRPRRRSKRLIEILHNQTLPNLLPLPLKVPLQVFVTPINPFVQAVYIYRGNENVSYPHSISSMDSIPLELTNAIVGDLESKADFLACRLVCKRLNAVATCRAFRVIKLVPEEESIQVIQNLVARPDLSVYVREVFYQDNEGQDFDNRELSLLTLWFNRMILTSTCKTVEVMIAITSCFLHLSKFENLVNLRLKFPYKSPQLYEHEASCNGRLQTAIFEVLASTTPPKKLRRLCILGILSLPHYSVHLPGFAEFLKPIENLDLLVASDHSSDYQSDYGDQLYYRFWTIDIPVFLKSPTSLKSLAIFTDRNHVYPDRETWDSLFYPNLTTLRLRNICFYGSPNTGAENFIVRHAASLTSLWICNCMIGNYDDDPNPKTSAKVLYRFGEKLTNLKDFSLFPTPGRMQHTKFRDIDLRRVAHCLGGQGYKSLLKDEDSESTDVEAYQSLQNAVNLRRRLENSCFEVFSGVL